MPPSSNLDTVLRELRDQAGLTLRAVEQQTGGAISNVYLSQLETGKRTDPNPRILVALAALYHVPSRDLLEAAGYLDPPAPSAVDTAFKQVLADQQFHFGTRFRGELDERSKRAIIELYERATGKLILPDTADEDLPSG